MRPHPAKEVCKCFAIVLLPVKKARVWDGGDFLGLHCLEHRALQCRVWANLNGAVEWAMVLKSGGNRLGKEHRVHHVVFPVQCGEFGV